MVHGNEVGSLPAAVRLVETLKGQDLRFGGRVTVFIGNPEAGLEDRRFLEADLNRVFLDGVASSHEANRAREIMPILDTADLFIDFHQTILATEQPYICSLATRRLAMGPRIAERRCLGDPGPRPSVFCGDTMCR